MRSVEEIQVAIGDLARDDFEALRDWLLDLDAKLWDEAIERDSAEGKLDALVQGAREAHGSGKTSPL